MLGKHSGHEVEPKNFTPQTLYWLMLQQPNDRILLVDQLRRRILCLNSRLSYVRKGHSDKCPYCDGLAKEDWHHFLYECPELRTLRQKARAELNLLEEVTLQRWHGLVTAETDLTAEEKDSHANMALLNYVRWTNRHEYNQERTMKKWRLLRRSLNLKR